MYQYVGIFSADIVMYFGALSTRSFLKLVRRFGTNFKRISRSLFQGFVQHSQKHITPGHEQFYGSKVKQCGHFCTVLAYSNQHGGVACRGTTEVSLIVFGSSFPPTHAFRQIRYFATENFKLQLTFDI